MKLNLPVAAAFFCGAILSAAVTAFALLRWHQQQSQLLWTNSLQQHLRFATHAHRGDVQALRADLDRRLPGLVLSVASFGRNEQTVPLLRSTQELLLDSGREIPPILQPAFRGL